MNAIDLLVAGARNNAWANHRLHAACALLSPDELCAERSGFFPTIIKTLNHILIVDWYYVDALLGEGRGRSVFEKQEETFADLAPLHEAQRAVDRKLLTFIESSKSESDLDAKVSLEREDHVQTETVGDVLLHLYQHQIHHRGQVHAMLSSTRVPPPQLDEYFLSEDRESSISR